MKERQKFIENLKKSLLQRREMLQQQVATHSFEKVSDGQVSDTGDEALALSMEKLQNSLQLTEINELRLIEEALSRMERGEYGICIECGEPISEQRLKYQPYAARCIICQEELEE